jgi:hypothetical protein
MKEGAWVFETGLTQEHFQGEHKYRRWISDMHPAQDDSGKVVIKVGECSHPIDPPGSSKILYSWRLWDLRDNVEIRRLEDFEDLFDPFG